MRRRRSLLLLLPWILLGPVSPGLLAQTPTTILTNGPTSNRINIVVLSEGYTTNQLDQFLTDATNAVNNLLAAPPYQEYKSYFNAFAISVASAQSGSDHHTGTITNVNTYFNSSYDNQGLSRLICIPPNDYDSNYSHGQGKVDALLASLVPEYDLVVMVVNDPQYGGSGGVTLITSVDVSSPEIVVHESGHSFGDLTDEYSDPYPGWVTVEYPNATAQTNRTLIKWHLWISDSTPVPTPATLDYYDAVGLFQGAEYQTSGWHRPKVDCKMHHLGIPFCEVCAEQLVKSIYPKLRSIDSFTPASTNVSVTTTQAIPFSVTTLQPMTHNLTIQWFTNGTAISGATNPTYTLFPQFFSNGTHTLRAQARDTTTLVRTDPANLLSNSVAWNLTVSVSQLRLISPQWLSGGRFACVVTGVAPQGFVIQGSTNLSNWSPISTNALVGGKYNFTNNGASGFARRFFRTVVTQ